MDLVSHRPRPGRGRGWPTPATAGRRASPSSSNASCRPSRPAHRCSSPSPAAQGAAATRWPRPRRQHPRQHRPRPHRNAGRRRSGWDSAAAAMAPGHPLPSPRRSGPAAMWTVRDGRPAPCGRPHRLSARWAHRVGPARAADVSFDELLATPTVKERKEREQQGELLDILMSKTAKERSILEKVRLAPHREQRAARTRLTRRGGRAILLAAAAAA